MKTGVGRNCKLMKKKWQVDKAHRNTELAGEGNEKEPKGKQINLMSV